MLGVHLTPPLLRAEAENHGNRVTVSVSPDFLHLAIETTRTTSSVSHDDEETTSCSTLFRQSCIEEAQTNMLPKKYLINTYLP